MKIYSVFTFIYNYHVHQFKGCMTCESPQISCFPISNGCVSTYPLPLLFWLEEQCREHLFPPLASLFPFPRASLRAFICPSSLVPYSFATKSFSWVSKEEHVSLILKDKASNLHFLLQAILLYSSSIYSSNLFKE